MLVRILARRKSGRPLQADEICWGTPGGLYLVDLGAISRMSDWVHIPTWQALNFCKGCGLDLDNTEAWRRAEDYLRKRPTFRYLRASDDWLPYWKPLLLSWRDTATPNWRPLVELQRRLKTNEHQQ